MDIPSDGAAETDLFLGGDIGGTSTRILVANLAGTVAGRGAGAGGNPVAHPTTAASALDQALRQALGQVEARRVRAAVIGMAGGGALRQPDVRKEFDAVWRRNGISCGLAYVSDLEVAFSAGTAEPDGTVLIAGTGTAGGTLRDRRVLRTVDGHGWLLGDDGSGFWLGREAARATLRTLDARTEPGPLAASVLRDLGIADSTPDHPDHPDHPGHPRRPTDRPDLDQQRVEVIERLNARPPVRLAELAPLVTAAFDAHDPVAIEIVEDGALRLVETIGRIRAAHEQTPIVLAGSVVRAESPVGAVLRKHIAERFAGEVLAARDGVGGATWLALAAVDRDAATEEVRARLVQP